MGRSISTRLVTVADVQTLSRGKEQLFIEILTLVYREMIVFLVLASMATHGIELSRIIFHDSVVDGGK